MTGAESVWLSRPVRIRSRFTSDMVGHFHWTSLMPPPAFGLIAGDQVLARGGGPLHSAVFKSIAFLPLVSGGVHSSRQIRPFRDSQSTRAGRAGFARNVCVGLGNWLASIDDPPEEAVAVLGDTLVEEEPLARAHAAAAFGP